MAINFETPGPVSPQTSSVYGAAEEFSRNLPTIAGIYGQAAQLQQHHALVQAQLTQQAAQAGADRQFAQAAAQSRLQEQGRESQQALAERQGEFAASREASPRDAFLAQVQGEQNRQRAELQSWLSQQEVGQAELMRYQRQQQAVSQVMADTNLDPEDRADILTQLRTGIDPVRQRLERSQAQKFQQQAQLEMEQAKREAIRTKTQQDLLATNIDARVNSKELPDGTWVHEVTGSDGKPHVQFTKPGEGGGGRDETAARKEFSDAYTKAVKTVDTWAAAREGTGPDAKPLYPQYRENDTYRSAVNRETARHLGYTDAEIGQFNEKNAPTVEGHLARGRGRRPAVRAGAGAGADTGGGGDYSQGGQQPSPEQQQQQQAVVAERQATPFKLDDAETQSPRQRLVVGQFDAQVKDVKARDDLKPAVRDTAVEVLETAKVLVARYGSVERMKAESPNDYQAFEEMKKFIRLHIYPAPTRQNKPILRHFNQPNLSS